MPFALAVPLAFVELAGVPTAIGVVHTALALQQTVDHIATVAAAIGQARIGRQQRFAVSASGEQQGKGKGSEWAHSGIRIIERRVCRSRGAEPSGLCAGSITCRSGLAREKLTGAAFVQQARVIADDLREQARSYSGGVAIIRSRVTATRQYRPASPDLRFPGWRWP